MIRFKGVYYEVELHLKSAQFFSESSAFGVPEVNVTLPYSH